MADFMKFLFGFLFFNPVYAIEPAGFDGFNYRARSTSAHQLQLLDTNELAFWHRLELIRNARKFIYIDIFYLMHDVSGNRILAALINKKQLHPEIDIRLHLDSWGSATFTEAYLALLQSYGLQVRKYLGPHFFYIGPHRKKPPQILDCRWQQSHSGRLQHG